jgi:hypothetical protein
MGRGKSKKSPMKAVASGVSRANNGIGGLASILDQQTQILQQLVSSSVEVDDEKSGGGTQQLIALKIQQAQLELQKDANASLKALQVRADKQVEALSKGNKDWKGFSDKFKDLKQNLKESIDPDNIKKALFGQFSMFKGARDKVKDIEYKQRSKLLDPSLTGKALDDKAVASRKAEEQVLRLQEQVDKLRRSGATKEQIAGSQQMKDRNAALNNFNQLQPGAQAQPSSKDASNKMGGNVAAVSAPLAATPSDTGKLQQSTTDMLADQQAAKENQLESIRILGKQTDLLQQIANNTGGKASASAAGGTEDSKVGGAGILGAFGAGLKMLGEGLKVIGSGAGKAIEGILRGLARGVAALANPKALLGLGALTLAFMGIGKALEWASPAMEAIAPVLMKVAQVIGDVFMAAIKAIPDAIRSIGDVIVDVFGAISDLITNTIDAVTTSVERLAAIDGSNLLSVAGGLMAISGALLAFGGSSVLTGIGNLVGGFLGAVTPGGSPIDQLQKIADMGGQLNTAASSIDNIGQAMKAFAGIDKKSMDAINDFPWVRATAFVAAGGTMSVSGVKIANASKANADNQAKVDGQSAASAVNTNVNQVNQNSIQNNTIKPSVRNQESSQSKYIGSRY